VSVSLCRFDLPTSHHKVWKLQPDIGWFNFESKGTDARTVVRDPNSLLEQSQFAHAQIVQQAGRVAQYRAFDYVWEIKLEALQDVEISHADCMCMIGLSTHLFPNDYLDEGQKSRKSTNISDAIIRTWLQYGDLYYALCDSNHFREDGSGWCFLAGGPSNWSTVRFRIEHELWEQARESRRDRVRGVYPGQYLSPIHLDKLGGKENFVAELLKVRDRYDDIITDLGDKGLILRLTPTPIDSSAYGLNQGFHEIATWVFRRFRDAGLFL